MKKGVALIGALLFLFSTAHATVWYVHPDSTLNSIQAGLDSCTDNDTVLVGPGIYYENIVWQNTQGIHLISDLGPDTTIIDGNNTSGVIVISQTVDSTTVIIGFTIQNGYANLGGGIFCDGSPKITGNIITNNTAHYSPMVLGSGGGIYCRHASSPIITDNIIVNNNADDGGGICCWAESAPTIVGNTIAQNTASECGGGISCWGNSSSTVTDNTITENTGGLGGGICCMESSPMITSNTITGNTAASGGGIFCFYYSSPTIRANTISENTANMSGGGILCVRSSASISCNTITNSAGEGSGVYCLDSAALVIDSCTISNNSGHGVYNESGANPIIHYSNITENSGYGVCNVDSTVVIVATYNWWGHSSGPGGVGPGTGDEVSEYVDYDPWLGHPVGIEEELLIKPARKIEFGATIFSGPLLLPEGKECKVFDITGRVIIPDKMKPGIYFIEIDGQITQKVVKVR